jgi:hypothetical protein
VQSSHWINMHVQQGAAPRAAYNTDNEAVLSPMRSVASLEAASPTEGDFARLLEAMAAPPGAVSGTLLGVVDAALCCNFLGMSLCPQVLRRPSFLLQMGRTLAILYHQLSSTTARQQAAQLELPCLLRLRRMPQPETPSGCS